MIKWLPSIRGRLFLLTAGVFIVLFAGSFYVHQLVEKTGDQAQQQKKTQHDLSTHLNRLKTALQSTEAAIYEYVLLLDTGLDQNIENALSEVINEVRQLEKYLNQGSYEDYDEDLGELHDQLAELIISSHKVREVSSDEETRYPAMRILFGELYVSNANFIHAVESALEEAKDLAGQPGQSEVNQLLWQIRYFWSQQISSFRVFVANRSGVFGLPEDALPHNLKNVYLYFDQVKELIDKLREYEEQGELGFQQSESLEVMQIERASYVRSFEKAADIYMSENWRADIPIIRKEIRPLFNDILITVGRMQSQAEELSRQAISQTLDTTKTLSNFVWALTVFVVALLLVFYLVFEYVIRRPILQVSRAMEAEAMGGTASYVSSKRHESVEIKGLLNAFTRMQQEVRSRQQRLESILNNAAEGIVILDSQAKIESLNEAALSLFGYNESELVGRHIRRLLSIEAWKQFSELRRGMDIKSLNAVDGLDCEFRGKRKDKTSFPMSIKVSQMEVEGRTLYTAIVSDISERKAMVEKLRMLAEHDSLTGLYNRLYFMDELERVVANAQRGSAIHSALIYIDLDNFKYVNDTLGHLAGDEVLIEVTELLEERLRKGDLLARLGGDEFAVLLYDVPPSQLHNVADAYRRQLSEYVFRKEGEAVDIGCSIGAALLEPDVVSKEDLLARADVACHIAKHAGRNRVHVYTAHDQESMVVMSADMGWARRIKGAIEEDRFVFARQPIVEIANGSVHSYELLLRMMDENGDVIMPGGFLPSAERFGLAVDIDKWVIRHAIRSLSEIDAETNKPTYAINLSADSVGSPEVLKLIKAEIRRYRIDPANLTFEITESIAIRNLSSASEFLSELRGFGCKTALDDFGSGYCSFAYLKDLPVDYVKIDGSFVRDLDTNHLHQTIVRSINEITHAMQQKTVAEFVENETVLSLLKGIGVDLAQGYHTGRPELLSRAAAAELPENVYKF